VPATNSHYHIDQNADYATITLLPGLNEAQWSDIEQAGTDINGRLNVMRAPAVLVDLTPLNYMGSSMVAMIVRFWKNIQSNKGRLVVVCNNDVVREVISLAGLTKVWPIVDSRDEALRELGFSRSGGVAGATGGDLWLVIVGAVAAVVGFVGVGLLLSQVGSREVALGLLFGGAGAAFVIGLVTLVRSMTSARYWGLVLVLAGVAAAIVGFMKLNSAGVLPAAPAEAPAEADATVAPDKVADKDK
jgi:anti-anti-sigma factor